MHACTRALTRYAGFFETLRPGDLDRLSEVYSEDVRFVDPFNDVRGVSAVRAVFAHMFRHCAEVRFEVLECVGGDSVGYLHWRFHFRLNGDRRERAPVDGVSRVRIASDGRVIEHVDYWDAAGGLYERLPFVGAMMRWLRRRMAA